MLLVVTKQLWAHKKTLVAPALVIVGIVAGIHLHARYGSVKVETRTIDNTKIITVDKPVLTEKVVTKLISDPNDKAEIAKLFADNKALHGEVSSLTDTIATLRSEGGGVVTSSPAPNGTISYAFHDWRLDFNINTVDADILADYTLHQQFKVFATTGIDKDGKPLSLVHVSEVLGNGTLAPLKVETVAVFADLRTQRWLVSPRIQAGVGISNKDKGAYIAFQWLKRGKSRAAEDTRWAFVSPALFVSKSTYGIGVLPISINLGTIPHQPFTNVWVSPFVSQTRVGGSVTATF